MTAKQHKYAMRGKLKKDMLPEEIIARVAEQSTLYCYTLDGERITTKDVGNALAALLKRMEE